jgi:serine phosphatase RsbU (regulator of sigma subunit)/PAS domain-containing protein
MALPATIPAEAVVDQLFSQNSVGVAVLDRDRRYVRVNDALAAMNRLPAAEHVGRTPIELLPYAAAVLEPLLETVYGGEPVVDVAAEVDGRSFLASYLPVHTGDQVTGVVGLVVETTESSRTEAALRVSQERLQLALEGTETGTFEWTIATNDLVWSENMGPIWGRERGWVPPSYEAYLETLVPQDAELLVADVSHAVTEGRDYEREFRVHWPDGQLRWLHSKVHVLPGEDGRPAVLVGLVSDVTVRRRRELASEYLARASLILAGSMDTDETLRKVADLAIPELGDWCAVHLVGPDGIAEQVAVAHQRPDQLELVAELQRRYPPDPNSPTGVPAVVRSGRPELYPEISDELLQAGALDADHLRLMRALRLRSVMVVPMVARGRTVGAMTFAFAGPGREYGTEELELAEELGRRAGLAVDNARLLHAEQAAHRRLRALQSVTDVALNHLELDELLSELLDRVRDITGSDLAEVLLIDDQALETRITVSGTIAAEPASTVRVPLHAGGDELGALRLLFAESRTVAPEDVELVELVADRVARAIVHARVYDQVRTTAVTLQRSLLPADLPALPGHELAVRYLPGQEGAEVGGDFYDAFPLADGRFAVVVGDVVGRGVTAAADMGQLRATLRAYLYETADPAAALSRLDALTEGLGGVSFATVALLAVDPRDGRTDVALAGHLPPLLRGADRSCRRLDFPPGLPIGAPIAERRQDTVVLGDGETVLLYTDGLVERRGATLDARIDELCGLLTRAPAEPEALLDHVLSALVPGGSSEDDVALVAVRRLP